MPRKLRHSAETSATVNPLDARIGPDESSGVHERPRAKNETAKVVVDPAIYAEARHQALEAERADIKERIKEMGGIWGEESYLLLDDRLREIEKEIGGGKESVANTAAPEVPREPSALELEQKKMKDLQNQRRRIGEGQKRVRKELEEYGIKSVENIEENLARIEEELRAEAEGKKPSWGYRITKMVQRMAGREVKVEAKESLKEYLELEDRMNANTRDTSELQEELYALGERRPRARIQSSSRSESYEAGIHGGSAAAGDLSLKGSIDTFIQAPAALRGQKELSKQVAELKDAESSQVDAERQQYAVLEEEMEGLRAEAIRGGAMPEEFDRLVAKVEKTKDKELAMLVQGYQRKMKEAEKLRRDLGMDVRPEVSMRVEAVKAREASAEDEERRFFAEQKTPARQEHESLKSMQEQKAWEIAADIETSIKNFESVKDDMDVLIDEDLFKEKQAEFAKQVQALEGEGSGKKYEEAMQAAEDALTRYAVAMNRRISRIRKDAAEAGPGEALPDSVIGMRAGKSGGFGTDKAPRRTVEVLPKAKPSRREVVVEKVQPTHEVMGVASEIEAAIASLGDMKEDMDVLIAEDVLEAKQNEFAKRLRALESEGSSEEYDAALQTAEDALARYAVALNRRLSSVRKDIAEAGPGEARPDSVIGMRAGSAGSYGTGRESRRTVELSRNSRVERQEVAAKTELVNKEVGMYRSAEWRKDLIDRINADDAWREFMHGAYEDVTAQLKKMSRAGHDLAELNSPDAALDYSLALFRGHARNAGDQKFLFSGSDRKMAQAEVSRLDSIMGWGERYKVKEEPEIELSEKDIEFLDEPKAEEAKSELRSEEQAESGPVAIEEEVHFQEKAVERAYQLLNREEAKNFSRAWVVDQVAKRVEAGSKKEKHEIASALYDEVLAKVQLEREPEIELSENDIEFVNEEKKNEPEVVYSAATPEKETENEMAVAEEVKEETSKKEKRVRVQPFESQAEVKVFEHEFAKVLKAIKNKDEKRIALETILGPYRKAKKGETLVDAFKVLYANYLTAREDGVRKAFLKGRLEEVEKIVSAERIKLTPAEHPLANAKGGTNAGRKPSRKSGR
ncbi:MAG: hypothetical protein WCK01_00615 [Candidatus Uhrbacteria bacterium]